jgi:hypothetical protein
MICVKFSYPDIDEFDHITWARENNIFIHGRFHKNGINIAYGWCESEEVVLLLKLKYPTAKVDPTLN